MSNNQLKMPRVSFNVIACLMLVSCGKGVDVNSSQKTATVTSTINSCAANAPFFPASPPAAVVSSVISPPSAEQVPARTSGVAPLAVFFDASGTTTNPVTPNPFHDLEYSWDFGDVAGGATWGCGSQTSASKNAAKGPEAAHVFESPGTYTVTLAITDGDSTHTSVSKYTIAVTAPDTVFSGSNTICFAASSTPQAGVDGCPAGAEVHMQAAFDTAVNSYAATGKRLLFKHDDVFTGTTGASIGVAGPGIVGMYGTGAKPIIHTSGAYATLSFGTNSGTMQDWRVMDLEIDNLPNPSTGGVTAGANADQITLLRLDIHNVYFGWNLSGDSLEYNATHSPFNPAHEFDQWTIADCNTYDTDSGGTSGSMGMYAFGHRFAILGSMIYHVITGEHAVRIEHAAKAVFSNNTFGDSAPTKQVFSLRAPSYTDVGYQEYLPNLLPGTMAYTTQVVVSDNHFIAGRSGQPVDNKPSAIQYNGIFSDIIFERNWYTVGTSTVCCGPMLGIRSQNVTVRNELFDLTGAATHSVITIDGATVGGPASSDVRLYNNTAFSNDAADIYMVRQYSGTANITIQNNFLFAPNAITGSNGPPAFYDYAGGTPALASNNTSDELITSSTALMTTVPPASPAGFKLQPGSYAYANGAGTLVPVWSDFNMAPLSNTSPRVMGAIMP